MTGVQDTVETAILGLINYVRNSEERLLIAKQTIENDEDRKTPNNEDRKRSENKNNYMHNLSGYQRIKQVKIGGEGWKKCA